MGGASDITAANDGRVMLVDWHDSCVHIFSEDGDYLDKFGFHCDGFPRIEFHQLTESVVIAVKKKELVVDVKIFTKDGEFVRSSTQTHEGRVRYIKGMTVTRDGRIAVLQDIGNKFNVLVT